MKSDELYKIIQSPHLSEKISHIGEKNSNQYAFKVIPNATKEQVKLAVESIFKVNVLSVNTVNVKGKRKRSRGASRQMVKCKNWKKAYVRIADDQEINFTISF